MNDTPKMPDALAVPCSWESVSSCVAAGSVVGLTVGSNLASLEVDVLYGNPVKEIAIAIQCVRCVYMDFRRTLNHEPGSGAILEAYLRTSSTLIDQLRSNELDGKAGPLAAPGADQEFLHLEVVGEVSLNVLCHEIYFSSCQRQAHRPPPR